MKIAFIVEEIERKNYHLFIEISIEEKKSRLLIDTGASKTVFDSRKVLAFVDENKIKRIETKSVGLGSNDVETKIVKLKKLKFGDIGIGKLEVAVLDLSHLNNSYNLIRIPEIDGVLGSDFLMKHKAIINFEKKVLSLKG